MNASEIGAFLRDLRVSHNLSQNELAKKINVTRYAISKWENGVHIPENSIINDICKLFNVSNEEMAILTLGNSNSDNNANINFINVPGVFFIKNEKNTLISIIFFLFFILFISLKYINSTFVYIINSTVGNNTITDGIISSNKGNIYFNIGNINLENNEQITKMELYSINKKNIKTMIYYTQDDYIILNDYGNYNSYFRNYDILNKNISYYLKVYTVNDSINFLLNYENNSINSKNNKNKITENPFVTEPRGRSTILDESYNEIVIDEEQLKKYSEEYDNLTITYLKNNNVIEFSFIENNITIVDYYINSYEFNYTIYHNLDQIFIKRNIKNATDLKSIDEQKYYLITKLLDKMGICEGVS